MKESDVNKFGIPTKKSELGLSCNSTLFGPFLYFLCLFAELHLMKLNKLQKKKIGHHILWLCGEYFLKRLHNQILSNCCNR